MKYHASLNTSLSVVLIHCQEIVHGGDFMSLVFFCLFLGLGFDLVVGFYHTPKTWVELRGV